MCWNYQWILTVFIMKCYVFQYLCFFFIIFSFYLVIPRLLPASLKFRLSRQAEPNYRSCSGKWGYEPLLHAKPRSYNSNILPTSIHYYNNDNNILSSFTSYYRVSVHRHVRVANSLVFIKETREKLEIN